MSPELENRSERYSAESAGKMGNSWRQEIVLAGESGFKVHDDYK